MGGVSQILEFGASIRDKPPDSDTSAPYTGGALLRWCQSGGFCLETGVQIHEFGSFIVRTAVSSLIERCSDIK